VKEGEILQKTHPLPPLFKGKRGGGFFGAMMNYFIIVIRM
jgi:hypothetical protein